MVDDATVFHLLPSTAPAIIQAFVEGGPERVVLVGTLQALDGIRRDVDGLNRRQRRGDAVRDRDAEVASVFRALLDLLASFDLVVIDEGHYEPAPSWSRTVRHLDRPTLLFSATPFRSDYKLFRVRGRYVFKMAGSGAPFVFQNGAWSATFPDLA